MKGWGYILLLCSVVWSCSNNSGGREQDTGSDKAAGTATHNTATPGPLAGSPQDSFNVEVRPFPGQHGWGYDIYMNGKRYIHQPHIPAISGNKGFATEEDARKAGGLVVHKIRNNIMPPTIDVDELDSLGVLKK
jgi:hypothetical protein